ncbi:sulfate/molybdate ABC transporter ATP-binding protein [Priestia koreensis]|uniref:sulfate/molybdate ABC transporter ATP-binding protein n=1 Tax=Priestia koreensis TaxID=284581 RepID=UPI0028F7148B|nr:sulfate/molybdate ABC transporter ATP-binding protein [Priestia koreensis]
MSIQIRNISKNFGSFKALQNIDLTIKRGELVALLGPSGSGKTSLLRIIAGLESADEGTILFDDRPTHSLDANERQVGFVFQHYALFRHMTVFDNVAYGLKVRPRNVRPSKAEIKAKVEELLSLVKLDHLASRYPDQLSGGQKQRVALARALAVEPKVLLLDEPFGALDAKVRKELRRWLRKLHDDFHITSIFVTHDQEEALDVADRIVVMNEGAIEQIGSPEEVYDHPQTPFVYNFLGNVNLFHGRLEKGRLHHGSIQTTLSDNHLETSGDATGYVRPHDLKITRNNEHAERILARVFHVHAIGSVVRVELSRLDNNEFLEAELTKDEARELNLSVGEEVYVLPKQLKVFVPEDFSI